MSEEIDYDAKHLLYLRHGKSNSAIQAGSDEARTLLDEGRERVKNTARAIRDIGLIPDLIICSGATRARQTLEEVSKIFGDEGEVEYKYTLYKQIESEIIALVNQTAENIKNLMFIGHEPSVSEITYYFSNRDSTDSEILDYISQGISTAECTILESKKSFLEWGAQAAKLITVLRG
ncbi:MAG: histidine phosphatase family protein [Bifidobacteriaceae bacterium]|jgi:phosphohistidine phosphatase|nr:histidine phosphatase family protein [Bifidobacteriaceae bacterium]